MKRKRRKSGMAGGVGTLMSTGIGLTVGSQVVESMGGPVGVKAAQAFQTSASLLPALGTATGAALVMRQTKKLMRQVRR